MPAPVDRRVSHDMRTPLALILGWAEQLERDAVLPERGKAGGIRTPERKPAPNEDLNLTSKAGIWNTPLRKRICQQGRCSEG